MSLFDDQIDNTDYLAELTGPGKKFDRTKYADEASMYTAIAKSNVHADRTITFQNSKSDEMRAELEKALTELKTKDKLDDYLSRVERKDDPTHKDPVEVKQPVFDENKYREMAVDAYKSLQQQEREAGNMAIAEQKLRERLGDNTNAQVAERMKSLGLTSDDLKFLAKKSPDAVINALGFNQQQPYSNILPNSNTRSDNFKTPVETRDAVFYEKMRREQPKVYFSEKTSVQRMKDMEHPEFLKRYNEQNARAFY